MEFVYRCLGATATLNQALSRSRINLIPFNWILMGIVGALAIYSLTQVEESIGNRSGATQTTVAKIASGSVPEGTYVKLTATVAPTAELDWVEKKSDGTEETNAKYFPAADGRGSIILLRADDGHIQGANDYETSVSGMVRDVDSEMQSKMADDPTMAKAFGTSGNILYVDTSEQPAATTPNLGLLIVSGLFLSALVITFLTRYIVFRRTPEPRSNLTAEMYEQIAAEGVDSRVTGAYALAGVGVQRFLEMRAVLQVQPDGDWNFYSNIDASNSFMGFRTSNRQGFWACRINPYIVSRVEYGRMYSGFSSRPALRVTQPGQDSTIVSFGSENQRELIASYLAQARAVPMSTV